MFDLMSEDAGQRTDRRRFDDPRHQVAAAGAFGGAVVAVAAIGSAITASATDTTWFRSLDTPPWYPPAAAFGVVWTILYALIAVAGWRTWRFGGGPSAIAAWAGQLALNLAWTVVFFGLHRPGWALGVILALIGAITIAFDRARAVDRVSGWLLAPYLAWTTFALSLNLAIAFVN